MTHLPAYDRRLPANCTLLRHVSSVPSAAKPQV